MFNRAKKDSCIYGWMPTLMWAFLIFMFSVTPYTKGVSFIVPPFDKIAHFFEYAVLSGLMIRSMYRIESLSLRKNFLFTLILSSGYGIVLELLQRFVPGRSADLDDVVANIIGIICGITLGRLMLWQK